MHVTNVRFEAFKSLYDVSCKLDKFTVITGPNGAGKSNFIDGLNFIGEVYEDGLEFAVGRSGGYDNIAHRRTRRAKRPVALQIEVKVSRADLDDIPKKYPWLHKLNSENPLDVGEFLTYRHRFTLGTASQALVSDFEIVSDDFEVHDSRGRRLLRVERERDGKVAIHRTRAKLNPYIRELLDPFFDTRFSEFISERPRTSTQLITTNFAYSGLFSEIRHAVGGTRVFQLSPHQCRTSGVPTPNAVLERHGENLPGAANHLLRNDRSSWAQVQQAMRDIMPGLEEIEVAYTEDRRLALQFRERGVGRPWNTNEVSDGTMQSLALFIALFDTRHPLLAIEEPENAVHPWILRRIIDICQRNGSPKQIIATTHSPVLLNYVNPAVVRLMTIKSGRSVIRPLFEFAPQLREAVANGNFELFELYDSGAIQEAVPRGFADSRHEDRDDE
ncbi:hypothetical protein GCM10022215_36900 [Nocardioides fonticola]|uniref:ATPase AAA-type core domain-containing protein n=1 Tax=Nocardioides fonticola TaxID=450363 RepID=A0ABP7XVW3_9ACTN